MDNWVVVGNKDKPSLVDLHDAVYQVVGYVGAWVRGRTDERAACDRREGRGRGAASRSALVGAVSGAHLCRDCRQCTARTSIGRRQRQRACQRKVVDSHASSRACAWACDVWNTQCGSGLNLYLARLTPGNLLALRRHGEGRSTGSAHTGTRGEFE